jgi:NADPH:quinone reductase-like Zn-dependent oxidoreductase
MRRAYVIRTDDPLRGIALRDVDRPAPGPGQVLVRIAYAPINPADLLLATDRHIAKPTLPATIGIEGAGVVEALGDGVRDRTIGQKVALPFGGTWSEAIAIDAAATVPLPEGVDLLQASTLCLNPVTASGLLEAIPEGSCIVQNAAASAVGKLVLRLGRERRIEVLGVVRREAQIAEIRALGGEAILDGPDLAERVRASFGKRPIGWAFDAVAGEASARMHACVADGGTLIVYGLLSDDRVILRANEVVFRDVTVRGWARLRAIRAMSKGRAAALYAPWIAQLSAGATLTEIAEVVPLSEIERAVALATREGRTGKIVIEAGR